MDNIPFYISYTVNGKVIETDYTPQTKNVCMSIHDNGAYCPQVSRVVTSTKTLDSVPDLDENGIQRKDKHGNLSFKKVVLARPIHTTVVEFEDGTKSIVKCSSADEPSTETAIVNAIVKRIYGKIDPKTNVVDGQGIGTKLRRLAENAFDQEAEAARVKAEKAHAREIHIARQAKESKAAHARKIDKLVKEIKNYTEALEKLGFQVKTEVKQVQPNETLACAQKPIEVKASQTYPTDFAKECYCHKDACSCSKDPEAYVRPNKPFSQFSQEEKREYWRAQKAGKLA